MARIDATQAGGKNVVASAQPEAAVYVLKDPRTMQVMYVGVTQEELVTRLGNHCSASRRHPSRPVCAWIIELAGLDLLPVIEEVESAPAGACAYAREIDWISRLRAAGASLLNCTDGGLGWTGHVHTLAARRKIGRAHQGKSITDEQRQRMSLAATGRKLTDEHKAKISVAQKGRPISAAARLRISEAKSGVPAPKTTGALNGRAVLTAEQAAVIRGGVWGLSEAMSVTGISKSQFYRVKRGEQWGSVTNG